MISDKTVEEHYQHGNLLSEIELALTESGKNISTLTLNDLAPVDEFHIGGRVASAHFLEQLHLQPQQSILDIGCGLGGAARFVASTYQSLVTGIDLTAEYIETGNELSRWLGLTEQVTLQQASALAMPFSPESFDGAYMMHVGMNIDDKKQLFKDVFRVLRSGSKFGIYDIMLLKLDTNGISYPVPWAAHSKNSCLATVETYQQQLSLAGFEVMSVNNRSNFALDFFKKMQEKNKANGAVPPLGLHTLMQASSAEKIKNMLNNITHGLIAPVEIILQKV